MEMGIGTLGGDSVVFKRKFRWLFFVPEVSQEGVKALAPLRSARPSYSFKENSVQHVNEEIFFPTKTEWKPITLVLYDTAKNKHPVVDWVSMVYNIGPAQGGLEQHNWVPAIKKEPAGKGFKKEARLDLYDGCGKLIEQWNFEGAWPQQVEFGDLDMSSNEIVLVTITLRYDRASWVKGC